MSADFHAVVTVTAETPDQAARVLAERLNHDEDYGFDYRLAFGEPFAKRHGKADVMRHVLGLFPDREELAKVIADALSRHNAYGTYLDAADAVRARILEAQQETSTTSASPAAEFLAELADAAEQLTRIVELQSSDEYGDLPDLVRGACALDALEVVANLRRAAEKATERIADEAATDSRVVQRTLEAAAGMKFPTTPAKDQPAR